MDKTTLIKNFSRYAHLYDGYADVQRLAAFKLLTQIKQDGFKKILEIGCGTGNYTFILRDKFRKAQLLAIDISKRMIEVAQNKLKAKGIEFMIADAENLDLNGSFDLITSNACFQWLTDLAKTLPKYKTLLNKKGLISFTIFGPLTFWELNASLSSILKDISIEANNFMTKEELKKILKRDFNKVQIKEIRYSEYFFSLKNLLEKIKYSGIRGNGLSGEIYFGAKFLKQLEEVYLHKFKQIQATYQIYFCQGYRR